MWGKVTDSSGVKALLCFALIVTVTIFILHSVAPESAAWGGCVVFPWACAVSYGVDAFVDGYQNVWLRLFKCVLVTIPCDLKVASQILEPILNKASFSEVTADERARICAATGGTFSELLVVSRCDGGEASITANGLDTQRQTCASGTGDSYPNTCIYRDPGGNYYWDDGPSIPPAADRVLSELLYALNPLFQPELTRRYQTLFWAAGQLHDYCYHHNSITYGYSKDICDSKFLGDMKSICNENFGKILSWFEKQQCLMVAEASYRAVGTAAGPNYDAVNTRVNYLALPSDGGFALIVKNSGLESLPQDRRLATRFYVRFGQSLGGWIASPSDVIWPMTGDFDGDGYDDIAISSDWGLGVISPAKARPIWGVPWGTSIAGWTFENSSAVRLYLQNMDGQGGAELIFKDGNNGVALFSWDSSQQAIVPVGTPVLNGEFWGNWRVSQFDQFVLFGDFNGDRRRDILITSQWGYGILAIPASSKQTLALHPYGTLLAGPSEREALRTIGADHRFVAATNFNGGPQDQILIQGPVGCSIASLDNVFSNFVIAGGYLHGESGGNWRFSPADQFLGTGDFNGDGRGDVIVRSSWGLGVLMGNSTGIPEAPSYAMHPNGQSIAGWMLQPTDTIIGITPHFMERSVTPLFPSEMWIKSNWGMALLTWPQVRGSTYVSMPAYEQNGGTIDGVPAWKTSNFDFIAATGGTGSSGSGVILHRR